jgi:GAF domain-containing protein
MKTGNTGMASLYDEGFDPDDMQVKVSELLVATADGSDELVDSQVQEVLSLLRQRLKMDVVFVSEFVDGQRVFRHVQTPADRPVIAAGDSGPLEESWCQRVVDGRMPELVPNLATYPGRDALPEAPFDIGTHLSTPILMQDGQVYGTLCCFSFSPHEAVHQRDLKNLKSVAMLMAQKLEAPPSDHKDSRAAPLTLQPLDTRSRF